MSIKTIYHFTALTGGAATALDSVDGNSLLNLDRAFVLLSNAFYIYELNASSGAAENSPLIISPDTNAGTKRWLLQNIAVINGDLLPDADITRNIGSATLRWANIYTADLNLRNDRGDWTVVEEENYLVIVNNKNKKQYKLLMEEI